jgi:hypothetical protein
MLFDGYVERMVEERRREESGRWAVRVYVCGTSLPSLLPPDTPGLLLPLPRPSDA